jgi:hypothetical protein
MKVVEAEAECCGADVSNGSVVMNTCMEPQTCPEFRIFSAARSAKEMMASRT